MRCARVLVLTLLAATPALAQTAATPPPDPKAQALYEFMDRKINVTVPITLKGDARGVKQDGGVLDFVHREIELEVLPANIPDSIEVDVTDLGIGDAVHVRDLAASAAWEPVTDADMMIVHIVTIKVVEEAPAAGAEGAAAAAPAAATAGASEPEVIKKGKTDEAKDDKKK